MRARPVYQHLARKTPFGRWATPDWIAIVTSLAVAIGIALALPLPFRWQLAVAALIVAPAVTMAELREQTGGKPSRWLRAQVSALLRPRRGIGGVPVVKPTHGHLVTPAPPPPPAREASKGSVPVELFE